MRFRGGGIGHSDEIRTLLEPFESDRDPLDAEYRQRRRDIEARGAAQVFAEEVIDELPSGSEDEGMDLDDDEDSDDVLDRIFKPFSNKKSSSDDDEVSSEDDWYNEYTDDDGEDSDSEDDDGISVGGEWDGEGGFIEALGYAPL